MEQQQIRRDKELSGLGFSTIKVIFLGTNGWYNTETGNTSCVLIDSERYYIVFDAGDGIYKLDGYIKDEKPIILFLSHFHLDHISGLHVLSKFRFQQGIRIYGQEGTQNILKGFVSHPFTCPVDALPTKLKISELSEGAHRIPFRVTCKKLLHGDPCFGYRIELDGKVITYCTDTGICDNDLLLSKDADLLIHDCAESPKHRIPKWQHTIPSEAATLAHNANVKHLVLSHFSAAVYKSIAARKRAESDARVIFKNTIAALDGMRVDV